MQTREKQKSKENSGEARYALWGFREKRTVTEKSSAWVETQHACPQSPNVSHQATTGPIGPPRESPSPFIGRSQERENLKATRESDP